MNHKPNQYYLVEVPNPNAAPQYKYLRCVQPVWLFGGFGRKVKLTPDEGREMVRKLLGKGE